MKWTDKVPTVPGWYWCRYNPSFDGRIYLIKEDDRGLYFEDEGEPIEVPKGCQWCGPLTPPEDDQ